MLRKPWFLLALVFPIVFSGCKKPQSNREVHPVKGKVTLDGEPVRLAVIYLEPKDPAIGNEAKGYIREDGSFAIRTYSNNDDDGAVAGEYKVAIVPYSNTLYGPKPEGVDPTPIPEKYRSAKTSDLVVRIEPGDNKLNLRLN
jgi:hypothetical protein